MFDWRIVSLNKTPEDYDCYHKGDKVGSDPMTEVHRRGLFEFLMIELHPGTEGLDVRRLLVHNSLANPEDMFWHILKGWTLRLCKPATSTRMYKLARYVADGPLH